jgi:glycosyltransferase involved in cell wall biosynthesis
MESDVCVSVAMAAYNSEKYIIEQIDSILGELDCEDELVISYNASTDSTWDIITGYAQIDNRVKITVCDETSIQSNFNNAILQTRGKYIFLSDHDDVWIKGKVEKIKEFFEQTKATVVMHERIVVDGNLKPIRIVNFDGRKITNRFWNNLISNQYCGSCMAFKRELIPIICPIPPNPVHHDMWIGLMGNLYGYLELLKEPLMYYRRHGSNASTNKRRNIFIIIKERSIIIFTLIARVLLLKRKGYLLGCLRSLKYLVKKNDK